MDDPSDVALVEIRRSFLAAIVEKMEHQVLTIRHVEDLILTNVSSAPGRRFHLGVQNLDLAIQIIEDMLRLLSGLATGAAESPLGDEELLELLQLEQCRRALFPTFFPEELDQIPDAEKIQLF